MRIHSLQHVVFEALAAVADWARVCEHELAELTRMRP